MALYMLMGRYSRDALKAIIQEGSDREAAARRVVEAAGGKLHAFYGMLGQDYHVAIIVEAAGHAQYIGSVAPAIASGALEAWKTIPLYTTAEMVEASSIARRAMAQYSPPGS